MRIMRFLMLALLACALALPAWAGNEDRAGTSGAGELRIPVSGRGIALGSGIMADVSGVDAMYYNPAGLSGLAGTELYFSHLTYIADMDKNYFAGAVKTGYGAFGFTVDVLSVGDIPITTVDQPEGTGQTYSPTFTVVGGTYSRFLTDAVSVGLSAKVVNESVIDVSATGVAFDVGLQYRPSWKNLRLGMLLRDFGPNMKYSGSGFESFQSVNSDPTAATHVLTSESASFELPSTFQVGASYTPYDQGDHRLVGYGNFTNNNFGRDEYSLGVEYTYHNMLSLRASDAVTGQSDYLYGPAYGIGVKVPLGNSSAQVDYAIRTVRNYFANNQVFSIKFAF